MDICSNFRAHFFKPEVCANCLRLEEVHTGNEVCANIGSSNSKTATVRGSVFASLIEATSEDSDVPNSSPSKPNRPASQQIRRPKAPPPVPPDSIEAVTAIKQSDAESHYYHKYGVGPQETKPETMTVVSESDAGTETVLVALPYAAVEIVINPPNYQLHLPPKLPATPSPVLVDKLLHEQGTLNSSSAAAPAKPDTGPYEVVEVAHILAQRNSSKTCDDIIVPDKRDTMKTNDSNTMKKNKSLLKKLFRIKDKDSKVSADDDSASTGTTNNRNENESSSSENHTVAIKRNSSECESAKVDRVMMLSQTFANDSDDGMNKLQTMTLMRRKMPPPPPVPPVSVEREKSLMSSSCIDSQNVKDISYSLNSDVEDAPDHNRQALLLQRSQEADKKPDIANKPKIADKPRAIGVGRKAEPEITNNSPTVSPRISLELKDVGLSCVIDAIEDIFKSNASSSDLLGLTTNSGGNLVGQSSDEQAVGADESSTATERQRSSLSSDFIEFNSSNKSPTKLKPGRPMQVPPPPPPSDGTEQDFSKDSFSFVTLPRTGRSVSVTKAEIDADTERSKKTNESGKKFRNKTLTEGIGVNLAAVNALNNDGASKSQTQLAEDRKSKFINRELPPLPWEAGEQQRRRDSCNSTNSADDDVNHLYELLPVSAQGKQAAEKKKKVAIADSVQQRDDVPVLPPRDKILDDKLATQNALGRSPRRPISKPSEQSSSPATNGNSSSKRTHGSSYVMVYFDDTVSPGEQLRCALSPDQALAKMAAVCLDTVQHMYEAIRKAVDVTTLAVSATEEINFAHITLLNTTAELIQGQAFFYRVSCSLLGLDSSLVMCTAKKLSYDVEDSCQLHLLRPCHAFHDLVPTFLLQKTARDAITTPKSDSRRQASIWVMRYDSVVSLDTFVGEMHRNAGQQVEQFEHYISYCLTQILDGVLTSYDCKHPIFALKSDDILAVTCGGRPEKFLVINVVCMAEESTSGEFKSLLRDLVQITFFLLNINCSLAEGFESPSLVLSKISQRSRYSRALKQVIEFLLRGSTLQDVLNARNHLECHLWGPSDEEMSAMCRAVDPVTLCNTWLDLARHRTVAQHALAHHSASVELAHMLRFLCTETGASLYNTAFLCLDSALTDK